MMFKKKEDVSKEKKIEVVSKNYSGLNFRKKGDAPQPLKEIKIIQKRVPFKDENRNTSRSNRKEQFSGEKYIKKEKESEEKSIFEEEETLEEQGYGILIRDMKKCIKGGQVEE